MKLDFYLKYKNMKLYHQIIYPFIKNLYKSRYLRKLNLYPIPTCSLTIQALRVSMEEQRNRKGPPTDSATTPPASAGGKLATPMETEEDAMLKQALGHGTSAASGGAGTTSSAATAEPETNLNEMTEEQQIAMAMRMSMARWYSASRVSYAQTIPHSFYSIFTII